MREVLQTVSDTIAPWLLTYAVHSTLLLGAVWILGCFGLPKRDALREVCWKAAMVGAVITASLQTVGDLQPVGGSLELPAAPVAHDDVAPVSLDWETLALLAEGVPLLDTEPVVAAESEAAPIPWTDIGWTAVALAALVTCRAERRT